MTTSAGYRLAPLLKVRQDAEDAAARALAAASARRAEAEAEQHRLRAVAAQDGARYAAQRQRPLIEPSVPIVAVEATHRHGFLTRLRESAATSSRAADAQRDGALRQARIAEELARAAYLEAHRAREALQKHRDRQLHEATRRRARAAERQQDETALVTHQRREEALRRTS